MADRRIRTVLECAFRRPMELFGGVDGEGCDGLRHGENTCDNDRHDSSHDPSVSVLLFRLAYSVFQQLKLSRISLSWATWRLYTVPPLAIFGVGLGRIRRM